MQQWINDAAQIFARIAQSRLISLLLFANETYTLTTYFDSDWNGRSYETLKWSKHKS